jgi:hypothetical protein
MQHLHASYYKREEEADTYSFRRRHSKTKYLDDVIHLGFFCTFVSCFLTGDSKIYRVFRLYLDRVADARTETMVSWVFACRGVA